MCHLLPAALWKAYSRNSIAASAEQTLCIVRVRGDFLKKHILPLLMMRPVRCDRCAYRVYVLRSVRALERGPYKTVG
jgi:hypothetical protein